MAVIITLHKKTRPANIRQLSLKPPEMSQCVVEVCVLATLSLSVPNALLHLNLVLSLHSSGYEKSSSGGGCERTTSTITAGIAYGRWPAPKYSTLPCVLRKESIFFSHFSMNSQL